MLTMNEAVMDDRVIGQGRQEESMPDCCTESQEAVEQRESSPHQRAPRPSEAGVWEDFTAATMTD